MKIGCTLWHQQPIGRTHSPWSRWGRSRWGPPGCRRSFRRRTRPWRWTHPVSGKQQQLRSVRVNEQLHSKHQTQLLENRLNDCDDMFQWLFGLKATGKGDFLIRLISVSTPLQIRFHRFFSNTDNHTIQRVRAIVWHGKRNRHLKCKILVSSHVVSPNTAPKRLSAEI